MKVKLQMDASVHLDTCGAVKEAYEISKKMTKMEQTAPFYGHFRQRGRDLLYSKKSKARPETRRREKLGRQRKDGLFQESKERYGADCLDRFPDIPRDDLQKVR